MKIRALESFSGALSMYKGQEIECDNEDVLKDLLQAGYIEEIKPENLNKEEEYKSEIESLKKKLEELKKVPENTDNSTQNQLTEDEELEKDVKSKDESKRNISKHN